MNFDEFIEMLVCPKCKGHLEKESEALFCRNCRRMYPFQESIPIMFFDISEENPPNTHSSSAGAKKIWEIKKYSMVAESLEMSGFAPYTTYLNYGYIPNENPQYAKIELPHHCLNKESIKLTLETIGDCDINGKQILEIGCGRGGNIITMNEYFNPKFTIGIDICPASIRFCETNHRLDNVFFINGDAEYIPFSGEAFDVLFNLESSHAYPDIKKFYREVFRVQKNGGYFLYSDCLPVETFMECEKYLRDLGFSPLCNRDITSNVLASCREVARKRTNAFDGKNVDISKMVESFVAVPGSSAYEAMKNGNFLYKILTLQKN